MSRHHGRALGLWVAALLVGALTTVLFSWSSSESPSPLSGRAPPAGTELAETVARLVGAREPAAEDRAELPPREADAHSSSSSREPGAPGADRVPRLGRLLVEVHSECAPNAPFEGVLRRGHTRIRASGDRILDFRAEPGEWGLLVSHPGWEDVQRLVVVHDEESRIRVHIGPRRALRLRVLDRESEEPLEWVDLGVAGRDPDLRDMSFVVRERHRVELDDGYAWIDLRDASYQAVTARLEHPDYVRVDSDPIVVPASGASEVVVFRMERREAFVGTLAVQVVREADRLPVEGAEVLVFPVDSEGDQDFSRMGGVGLVDPLETDARGRVELDVQAEGALEVVVRASGYAGRSVPLDPLRVGELLPVHVELRAGASLRGVIHLREPLTEGRLVVKLRGGEVTHMTEVRFSGPDPRVGTFELEDLPTGELLLVVSDDPVPAGRPPWPRIRQSVHLTAGPPNEVVLRE